MLQNIYEHHFSNDAFSPYPCEILGPQKLSDLTENSLYLTLLGKQVVCVMFCLNMDSSISVL